MIHTTMTMMNQTFGHHLPSEFNNQLVSLSHMSKFSLSDLPLVNAFTISSLVTSFLTLSTLWKIVIVVLVFANLKSVPLMYHMRLVNAFRFVMRSQRSKIELTSASIFQPIITTSRAPLMEIDLNLHKTNSSYFSDNDIARTHLLCTLFSKGVAHFRGSSGALSKPGPMFNLALGAVSCSFKKELKPYEKYEMWSRVLSWDEKWVYIVTHFVRQDSVKPRSYTLYPQQNSRGSSSNSSRVNSRRSSAASSPNSSRDNSPIRDEKMDPSKYIVATALNKCVFKLGRKTIPPIEMLRISGLLPAEVTDMNPVVQTLEANLSNVEVDKIPAPQQAADEWDWTRIEGERRRGMEVAKALSGEKQLAIEQEFSGEAEALGRHRDGAGITGVVSTLAQLAKIKKKQIL